MTQEERCELALQTKEPERALRALVLDLTQAGRRKAEIYTHFESVLVRVRAGNGGEAQEDAILNVMDALTGWHHPDARLLVGDASLSASGAETDEKQR